MTRRTSTLWTFAITSLALFMVSLDNLVVTTAIPVIRTDLGASLEQVWRVHQRALRMRVVNDVTALLVARGSLDDVFAAFAASLTRLVRFDALAVALVDAERAAVELVDVLGRGVPGTVPRLLKQLNRLVPPSVQDAWL